MRRFAIAALLILLLTGAAVASDAPDAALRQEQESLLGVNTLEGALPEQVQALFGNLDSVENAGLEGGVEEILRSAVPEAQGMLRTGLRTAGALLATAVLLGIAQCVPGQEVEPALRVGGVLAVTLLCAADLNTLLGQGKSTLTELSAFTAALYPVLAGATVASGAAASGGALYAGTVFFVNLLTSVMTGLLVPACYALVLCACAELSAGSALFGRLRAMLAKGMAGILKALLLVFSGYLAITGAVSGSADAASVKAAKVALSSMVPVVGSVIADASETLLVSASMIRNAAGLAGLLGVMAVCIGPFLRLAVQYLLLKLTAALSAALGGGAAASMMDALGSCMGLLLGMVGSAALLNFIACVCFLKAVVPG